MPLLKDLFLTRKVYFLILSIFIILVLAVVMLYKYGLMPDFLVFNKSTPIKIFSATYVDPKYDFKIIYPANKFVFKSQSANFYIYDEVQKEANMVDVSKNTPFNLVITYFPSDPSEYFLTVNPIDLFIFVLIDKSKDKSIGELVNEEKVACSESYKGGSRSGCEVERLAAEDGRPIYVLKGWANNKEGTVMESIYLPYNNYILKFNFIYSEAALKAKNPDAILRQSIITYIISNSFKVNLK
jgi:hypothetical protein